MCSQNGMQRSNQVNDLGISRNLRDHPLHYSKDYRYDVIPARSGLTHTKQLLFIVADM